MYGIDLSVQIENLMPALGLGFILGFVYDVCRFIRISLSKNNAVLFICDLLFVIFCTISSYLMILGVNNGNIRLYLILAEITGCAVYFCTAGIIISKIFHFFAKLLRKVFCFIASPFICICKKSFHLIKNLCEKVYSFLKKSKNKFKNHLKDEDEMLYNNNN